MEPCETEIHSHPPTGTTIRAATDANAVQIRGLVFGVLAEYGLPSDPDSYDADLFDIEKHYRRPGGWFDVVETQDGCIVGTVGLVPSGEGVCELRKMYLAPAVRGYGLGTFLLKRAIGRARRAGFRRMQLETSSRLREANRLYTRYGFRPIEHSHGAERCDTAYALDLTSRED